MVVKVEASEERVNLIGLVNLSTEMDTLPATALPNMFSLLMNLRHDSIKHRAGRRWLETAANNWRLNV